ncbi:TetR/AcrR family transcriptional regulator [Streptococcus suis]|nr:TetR/AcrR family transcriptional regulator [Streptococcus suis]
MTADNRKERTKQSLLAAMADLLTKESFDQITTTELARAAHISRSGFYTHYKDKYEMIDRYQSMLFNQLEYIFDKHSHNKKGAILETFEFLNRDPLFASLLSTKETRDIQEFLKIKFKRLFAEEVEVGFSQGVQSRFQKRQMTDIEKEYGVTYLVNALFGVCQMWIERGKIESPEQMTNFVLKMIV